MFGPRKFHLIKSNPSTGTSTIKCIGFYFLTQCLLWYEHTLTHTLAVYRHIVS